MQQTAAIYIHVPFCKSKCRYCSFISASSYEPETMDVYLQRVKEELTQQAEPFSAYRIESVFFGGGTPSLLPKAGGSSAAIGDTGEIHAAGGL